MTTRQRAESRREHWVKVKHLEIAAMQLGVHPTPPLEREAAEAEMLPLSVGQAVRKGVPIRWLSLGDSGRGTRISAYWR